MCGQKYTEMLRARNDEWMRHCLCRTKVKLLKRLFRFVLRFEPFRGFGRVRNAVELRDKGDNYIKKVRCRAPITGEQTASRS